MEQAVIKYYGKCKFSILVYYDANWQLLGQKLYNYSYLKLFVSLCKSQGENIMQISNTVIAKIAYYDTCLLLLW